jgi:hypothetical protein
MLGEEIFRLDTSEPKELSDLQLGQRFLAVAFDGQCFQRPPGYIAPRSNRLGDVIGEFKHYDHASE